MKLTINTGGIKPGDTITAEFRTPNGDYERSGRVIEKSPGGRIIVDFGNNRVTFDPSGYETNNRRWATRLIALN